MGGSFLAEVLKLRKRPAVWVLGALWLVIMVLFFYLLPALTIADDPPEAEAGLGEPIYALAPQNLSAYLISLLFPSLGTAVALILGALAAGSEYGWGTLKVILSQRPGRFGVLLGKLLALCTLLLFFVLAAFLVGAVSSLAIALLSGAPSAPPTAAELLKGMGAGVLILIVWAAFSFALATLSRSTALAVGFGLTYAFAIEQVFLGFLSSNESLLQIAQFLLSVNTSALSLAFAEPAGNSTLEGGFFDPTRSAIVLIAYTAVFLRITTLVFCRRDITE
jgi:ABC-2 type transport system permease protein